MLKKSLLGFHLTVTKTPEHQGETIRNALSFAECVDVGWLKGKKDAQKANCKKNKRTPGATCQPLKTTRDSKHL